MFAIKFQNVNNERSERASEKYLFMRCNRALNFFFFLTNERDEERDREGDVLLLHSCTCVLSLQPDTICVNEMCVYILKFLKQSPSLKLQADNLTEAAEVVFVSAALRPLVCPAEQLRGCCGRFF